MLQINPCYSTFPLRLNTHSTAEFKIKFQEVSTYYFETKHMQSLTPDLCDAYPDIVRVVETDFNNYGKRRAFGGEIVTVKCFEDNSLVKAQSTQPGQGKVLVVDGGGSSRRALLGDMIGEAFIENGWEGIIIYGRIRDANILETMDLGVQALGTVPIKSTRKGLGELNVTVHFGGVDFIPGQFVYADVNGVIISPKAISL